MVYVLVEGVGGGVALSLLLRIERNVSKESENSQDVMYSEFRSDKSLSAFVTLPVCFK